jgi:hypothetical protein
MPRKPTLLTLSADEMLADDTLKLLCTQRFAALAAQMNDRGLSLRSGAVACAAVARAAHPDEVHKQAPLALIRLVQLAGSRPSEEDVARYANAAPAPATPTEASGE